MKPTNFIIFLIFVVGTMAVGLVSANSLNTELQCQQESSFILCEAEMQSGQHVAMTLGASPEGVPITALLITMPGGKVAHMSMCTIKGTATVCSSEFTAVEE